MDPYEALLASLGNTVAVSQRSRVSLRKTPSSEEMGRNCFEEVTPSTWLAQVNLKPAVKNSRKAQPKKQPALRLPHPKPISVT